MADEDYELGYLSTALTVLEDYLLSGDIYWSLATAPPSGLSAYPNLTLGTVLLMLHKLRARSLAIDKQSELARLELEIDRSQARWRSAWEKKAGREFGARITLWRNYLEEYRIDPENNADRYAYEVSRRVMLTLLQEVAKPSTAEQDLLKGLDRLLRSVFVPGEFIWKEVFLRGFPVELYWYLYGHIRSVRA